MMLLPLLFILSAAPVQDSFFVTATASALESRTYPLPGLEPVPLSSESVHFPMSPFHFEDNTNLWLDAGRQDPEFPGLVELLIQASPEEFDSEGASVDFDEGKLYLRGSAPLIERSEKLLDLWRDEALRPTDVRLLRGTKDEMKLLHEMQLDSSAPTEVRRTRLHPIISSFELNVAQHAANFVPLAQHLIVGDIQMAAADPHTDGVHISWLSRNSSVMQWNERTALIRTQLSTESGDSVDYSEAPIPDPVLLIRSVATSAGLTQEGNLEIETSGILPGIQGWSETHRMEPSSRLPVAVHDLSHMSSEPMALLSLGSFIPNRWEIQGLLTSVRGGWPETGEPPYWLTLARANLEAERELRLLLDNDDVIIDFRRVGPFGYVSLERDGPEESSSAIAQYVEPFRKRAELSKTLEVVLELKRSGTQEASIMLRAPIASGSALVATVGSERLAIVRSESYIAEGSSICAPLAAPRFQGLIAHFEPMLLPNGTLYVSFALEGKVSRGQTLVDEHSGIESESFDVLSLRESNLRMERGDDGSWTRLFGSRDEEVLSLSLTVREK